jgi:hypothetical protein
MWGQNMANAGTFKKGEKKPNQGKRGPGKTTLAVKEAFREAFDNLGGVDALVRWAQENPTDFYKLASKLIPTEVRGPGDQGEHTFQVSWQE